MNILSKNIPAINFSAKSDWREFKNIILIKEVKSVN